MAEIEPASDEMVKKLHVLTLKALRYDHLAEFYAEDMLAVFARIQKTEADNANLTKLWAGYAQLCREHGIEPSSSEVYAAANRITERADKAEAELARLKAAIAEADKHAPEAVHFIRAMTSAQGGGNG